MYDVYIESKSNFHFMFTDQQTYPSLAFSLKFLTFITGLEFGEKEKQSFIDCQTCNQTKCEYRKCDEKINNTVFCARQNVITVETSSPSSVMVTTFVETKTSPNKPMTSNSNYIPGYTTDTTDHKKVSQDASASETGLGIGKGLAVLVGYKNRLF